MVDGGENYIKLFNKNGADIKTYKNELLDCINTRREAVIKNFFTENLIKIAIPRTLEQDVQLNSCLELYDKLEEYVEDG